MKPVRVLVPLLVAGGLLAGCGSTRTVTVQHAVTIQRPPNLGAPQPDAKDTGSDLPKAQQNGNVTLQGYRPKHGNPEMAKFYNASGCGVERWAVKTLTDPGANQVTLVPQASTIADLVSIAPPKEPTDRVGPTETTTFKISGTLIFAKQEADGDYHLVLEDGSSNTMIVESPSPSCAGGSVVLGQITEVRAAIDKRLPELAAGQVIKPGLPVTVTGVGFFDRLHGQTGVAPNGIELHPLTSIEFAGVTAARAPVPHLVLREVAGTD